MRSFNEHFAEKLDAVPLSTQDVVTAVAPLMEQLAAAHDRQRVGPRDFWGAIRVEDNVFWFEDRLVQVPELSWPAIEKCQRFYDGALTVVAETVQVAQQPGGMARRELRILEPDEPFEQPGYIYGGSAWEQVLGHHDALVDAFLTGLLLGSVALGIDLRQASDLQQFVQSRQNLFQLHGDLHPVIARAIVQLTELDRNRRVSDLRAIAASLRNYRGESVELEYELASIDGFQSSDPQGKQATVLTRLQHRLFDLSRRNRLLHFRSTASSANLTMGSVPLTQDVRTIREEQLLVWGPQLHKKVVAGESVLLNEHLNFVEALYLPTVLDRIRSEARRDEKEYGFAQLRLVACFLRWSNLKEDPPQRYDSPFVLVPVALRKEKGVPDQYFLQATSPVAEINPAVRYHLKTLFGVELPESIDLQETDVEQLYRWLNAQLQRSASTVELSLVDRPAVEAVYLKARRRMEQHRRRARSRGRGKKNYRGIDYSYDAATYDPLGIKLFLQHAKFDDTVRQTALHHSPNISRDAHMVASNPKGVSTPTRRRVRALPPTINHHRWEFDACSVTLANFRYRRMSLVRDYESVLAEGLRSEAFDATFSLTPKPIARDAFRAPPLAQRFDILPADPSQAAAIGAARQGCSYIVQGPPGTGKSQTIANLIADYVGRGQRVLFVCEKRAAIDVVYSRLCTQGLGDVCTIIHDALTDKKPFVMELARTYEAFLEPTDDDPQSHREAVLSSLQHQLEPLQRFAERMTERSAEGSISVASMLEKLLQLPGPSGEPIDERLPDYSHWHAHSDLLRELRELLAQLPDASEVLAEHPLVPLSPVVLHESQPRQLVSERAEEGCRILTQLEELIVDRQLPMESLQSPSHIQSLRQYIERCRSLAACNGLALTDPYSAATRQLEVERSEIREQANSLRRAEQLNEHWVARLDRSTAEIARDQLARLENRWTRFLTPTWWKLTAVLKRSYRLDAHEIRPPWSQVIDRLLDEYRQAEQLERAREEVVRQRGFPGDLDELDRLLAELTEYLGGVPLWLEEFHRALCRCDDLSRRFAGFDEFTSLVDRWEAVYSDVFVDLEYLSVSEIVSRLSRIETGLPQLPDFFDCLRILERLPADLATLVRTSPRSLDELQRRLLENQLLRLEADDREYARFNGEVRDRLASRGFAKYQELLMANAAMIRGRVRERFLRHVELTQRSNSELDASQREQATAYKKGRRVLEHEFGKSMRYRSIRDLVSGDSGAVVRDLKPVWLMSPLSVADSLPLGEQLFDVVIFDEASQVTLESAAPTLFRAAQVIIVGDEMQLPPTSFFESQADRADDELVFEEEGETHEYSLAADSLLNHAGRNLASTMLSWHYRSRNESLISFSNWRFYHGRLLTVPEEQRLQAGQEPLLVAGDMDVEPLAAAALQRAVSFHHIRDGVYERRRNTAEAEYIAKLVRGILRSGTGSTVGIIAFSEAQQDEIDQALRRLGEDDEEFRQQLELELEREEDGQFVGLLVKNLENIQGDERDVILLSVCYGPGPDGRMLMNFGPINRAGGEKRLNVAFTRAKHHMMVIGSFEPSRISNEHNDGASCLKNYLRYAAAASIGHAEEMELVLRSIALGRDATASAGSLDGETAAMSQLASQLGKAGYHCDTEVGHSGFRCDLAVYRDGDPIYRLGILLDGEGNYQLSDPIEREILRPRLLENFGWRIERVLVKDWWTQPEVVMDRLMARLEPLEAGGQRPEAGG